MEHISLSEFEITHFDPDDLTRAQLENLCARATEIHQKAARLIWDQVLPKRKGTV